MHITSTDYSFASGNESLNCIFTPYDMFGPITLFFAHFLINSNAEEDVIDKTLFCYHNRMHKHMIGRRN